MSTLSKKGTFLKKLKLGCITIVILSFCSTALIMGFILSLVFFPAVAVKISNDPTFQVPDMSATENRNVLKQFNDRFYAFMTELNKNKYATFSATDTELNVYAAENIEWEGLEQPYSGVLFTVKDDDTIHVKAQLAFNEKKVLITWGFGGHIAVVNEKIEIDIIHGQIGRLELSENQAKALFNWMKEKSDLDIEQELDLGFGIKNIYVKNKKVYIESILEE